MYFTIGPLKIFWYYLDLLKDTILAVELVKIVGGWSYISNNATEFMPAVSFISNDNPLKKFRLYVFVINRF